MDATIHRATNIRVSKPYIVDDSRWVYITIERYTLGWTKNGGFDKVRSENTITVMLDEAADFRLPDGLELLIDKTEEN